MWFFTSGQSNDYEKSLVNTLTLLNLTSSAFDSVIAGIEVQQTAKGLTLPARILISSSEILQAGAPAVPSGTSPATVALATANNPFSADYSLFFSSSSTQVLSIDGDLVPDQPAAVLLHELAHISEGHVFPTQSKVISAGLQNLENDAIEIANSLGQRH